MNQQMLTVFFWLYVTATFSWLFLSSRLINLLRYKYPETYKSLGYPSLIMSRYQSSEMTMLRFLVGRHYKKLNDQKLDRLCGGMLCIGFLLLITFGGYALLLTSSFLQK
jgi:hypothetical protein